jgi:acyl-lipid omega-6 desaturase (Delta-12 desaturase)
MTLCPSSRRSLGVHRRLAIPFYRLLRVLREHPELKAIGRITLTQSLACVRLAL